MSNFWNHLMRRSSFLFSSKEEDDAEVFTESNEEIGATNTEVISESFPMTGNDAITDQHMEEPEPFTATFDEVEHNQKQSNDAHTAYFDEKTKNNEDQEALMANLAKGNNRDELEEAENDSEGETLLETFLRIWEISPHDAKCALENLLESQDPYTSFHSIRPFIDFTTGSEDFATYVVTLGLQAMIKLAPSLSPVFLKECLPSLFPSLLQTYHHESFDIRRATVFLLVTFREMDEDGELEELFDQLTPSQRSVIQYYVNERHNERLENECNEVQCNEVQLVATNNKEWAATSALLQMPEKEKKKPHKKNKQPQKQLSNQKPRAKKKLKPNTRYNRVCYLYVQQEQMLLNSILFLHVHKKQGLLKSSLVQKQQLLLLHVHKKQGLLKKSLLRKQQLLLHNQPTTSPQMTSCNRH